MFNRYCNFTTCIRSDNLAAIKQAVTHLLEQEKDCRLTQLPQLKIDLEQLCNLPVWELPRLWIVGLFSSTSGWTIVKTWPAVLLCLRAEGANRPRLSALAEQLECDAFHFYVTRDINGVLLEADATGRIFISGWSDYEEGDPEQFFDEQIDEPDDLISQFSLLEVPQSMQVAMRVHEDPEIPRKEAEYEQLRTENPNSELLSELMGEVYKGYAERIDIALAEVMNSSKSCWYLRDLLYYAYAEPQRLEAEGTQLLYFQPPLTHKPPGSYIPLSPEPLSEDEGDEF